MKFSIRGMLIALVAIAFVCALVVLYLQIEKQKAELMAQSAELTTLKGRPSLHHASAEVHLHQVGDQREPDVKPLVLASTSKQFSVNMMSRSISPAADLTFSYVVRHLRSTQDGDVYEVIWSEGARLPPECSTHDFPNSSKILKTGSGVATVHESDKWKLEIADSPGAKPSAPNPNGNG